HANRQGTEQLEALVAQIKLIGLQAMFRSRPLDPKGSNTRRLVTRIDHLLKALDPSSLDLPALATGLDDTDATGQNVDTLLMDPELANLEQGQRLMELLDLLRKHGALYRSWQRFGFADLDVKFVMAMEQAGWRWGGRFSREDLHHFDLGA
ncbi:MAG: M15 family metallopeptidase, partial [Myxococcota bacterium]